MTFIQFKEMRETIRQVLAGRTWVSYGCLLDAVCGTFHCTRDEAVYALRDLVATPTKA